MKKVLRIGIATIICSILVLSDSLGLMSHIPHAHAAGGDVGIWIDQNGSLTATTTFATFPFEGTGSEERNDGIYTYNASTNDVTIAEPGNYLILGYIRYTDTSNARANWQSRITLNGSPVAGSYGYGFNRNNNKAHD